MIKKKIDIDLSIILIWIAITFLFIVIPELKDSFIRTILGIPMILFIPGYVLVATLFPRKNDLEIIERIALSFGLSVAVVPLLGLLLNFTFGIRLIPILITLCIYTIVLIVVARYRRRKLPEKGQFSVQFNEIYEIINSEINSPKNKIDRILTIILIFTIVSAIGMIFYIITMPKTGEKFTEFYILGPDGKADKYSTNLTLNASADILVGVINHEYAPINYTIQTELDKNMLTSEKIVLNNNETWEKNVTFVPDKKGSDMKLEFLLFKENNFTSPYRELHLWVNTT